MNKKHLEQLVQLADHLDSKGLVKEAAVIDNFVKLAMPVCFQLYPKGSSEPAILQQVDDRMWREIGQQEPSSDKWFCDWYNTIGLRLALGKKWDEIRADITSLYGTDNHKQWLKEQQPELTDQEVDEKARFQAKAMRDVVDFLEKNYTTNSWHEQKH